MLVVCQVGFVSTLSLTQLMSFLVSVVFLSFFQSIFHLLMRCLFPNKSHIWVLIVVWSLGTISLSNNGLVCSQCCLCRVVVFVLVFSYCRLFVRWHFPDSSHLAVAVVYPSYFLILLSSFSQSIFFFFLIAVCWLCQLCYVFVFQYYCHFLKQTNGVVFILLPLPQSSHNGNRLGRSKASNTHKKKKVKVSLWLILQRGKIQANFN